ELDWLFRKLRLTSPHPTIARDSQEVAEVFQGGWGSESFQTHQVVPMVEFDLGARPNRNMDDGADDQLEVVGGNRCNEHHETLNAKCNLKPPSFRAFGVSGCLTSRGYLLQVLRWLNEKSDRCSDGCQPT